MKHKIYHIRLFCRLYAEDRNNFEQRYSSGASCEEHGCTYAVEPATGKFKHKGFKVGKGIPSKGGNTTNFEIPEWMFDEELKLMNSGVI